MSKSIFLGLSEPVYLGHISEEWKDEAPPNFIEEYDLISYAAWAIDPEVYNLQSHWLFGNASTRTCAFCGLSIETGAKFESVSHAIPEGLGNKRVISLEECDVCNIAGGRCEDELAKMLDIERVFSGARGKNGPASIDADDKLEIVGKGIGKPIEVRVDASDNPIKDLGNNALELPIRNIEYRPLLALRSVLRSTWLLLPAIQRKEFDFVKRIAKGEDTPLPFEFFSAFSSGVARAVGRIRIWKQNGRDKNQLPPLIVAVSVSNSTVIWRAPLNGRYVRSPLPPIPALDKEEHPQLTKLTITSDEKVISSHNFQITYEKKVEREVKDNSVETVVKTNPLKQITEKADVELSLGYQKTLLVDWVKADRKIQKIRGDFTGPSEILFRAKDNGLRLEAISESKHGEYKLNFSFNPVGKMPTDALIGLKFFEAYMNAADGDSLLIKDGENIASLPLSKIPQTEFKEQAESLKHIRADLEKLEKANTIAGISLRSPTPPERDAIMIAATAITLGVPVRVNQTMSFVLPMARSAFDKIIQENKPVSLVLGKCIGSFANNSELTESKIGPIYIGAVFNHPAEEFKDSIVRDQGANLELAISTDFPEFFFERFKKT